MGNVIEIYSSRPTAQCSQYHCGQVTAAINILWIGLVTAIIFLECFTKGSFKLSLMGHVIEICSSRPYFRVVDLFPAEVYLVTSLLRQIGFSKHTLGKTYFRGVDLSPAEMNLVASLLARLGFRNTRQVRRVSVAWTCFRRK